MLTIVKLRIINLRNTRASCHGLNEGNKKAAKDHWDYVKADPHEEGDVKAVVLLLHTMVSPLPQQAVLQVGQQLNGDVNGAGHQCSQHPHNKHHSPAKDVLRESLGPLRVDHKGIADLLEHKLVTLVPHLVDQDRVVVGVIVQALVLFAIKELSLYCGDVIQEIYKMF